MKSVTTTFFLLLIFTYTIAVHAKEEVPAFFLLKNQGSNADFDLDLWRRAAPRARSADLVQTYLDPQAIEKAIRDAASAGVAPNAIFLLTTNVRAKNSTEFQGEVDQLKSLLQANPELKGSKVLFEWPMCVLLRRPQKGSGSLPVDMLFVLEDQRAKLSCYTAVQAYFTTAPGPDGDRPAPVWFDAGAVALQMLMPPMKFVRTFLADKTRQDADRGVAKRDSNVYSQEEEIFIFAAFEHVGRKLPGTPFATYEIGVEIEIRDQDGKVIAKKPNVHTYQGKSTPRFPLDPEYFTNHATAGIKLSEPGDYKVAFIFTDQSRPANETAPIEAVFDVAIR